MLYIELYSTTVTLHGDSQVTAMRGRAVLPEKDSLPGSKHQLAGPDRYLQVVVSKNAADMSRHIIRALGDVTKTLIPIGYQVGHKPLQVATNRRIGVLAQHQGSARMLQEDMTKPRINTGAPHGGRHVSRDIIGTAPVRRNIENFLPEHGNDATLYCPPYPAMTPERFQKLKSVLARRQPDLTLLAENVHKSHNISALLRTADAVGIHAIHAVSPAGDFPTHHFVSGGSKKWVNVLIHESVSDAASLLKESGHVVLAAHVSESARDYRDIDYTKPTAILLGSELDGVTPLAQQLADDHVAIPMDGQVASLNVSVAAAIILYEARRQRDAAGLYDGEPKLPPDEYDNTLFEWSYPDIAERCRARGLAYPDLTTDGMLKENPFMDAV